MQDFNKHSVEEIFIIHGEASSNKEFTLDKFEQVKFTAAIVTDPQKGAAYGIAVTDPRDNFSRAIGREIAIGRAKKQLFAPFHHSHSRLSAYHDHDEIEMLPHDLAKQMGLPKLENWAKDMLKLGEDR